MVSAAVVSPMNSCEKDLTLRDFKSKTWILDYGLSQHTTV